MRLLCQRNFPAKNTGVGCHALLQDVFPAQGTNPGLPHCRWILYHLNHPGSPLLPPAAAAAAKSLQSCPTLCDPIYGSLPGSAIPGILQARTLEWQPVFLLQCMKVKSESEVAQSCPTLSDPMDCSLPGSSVHGIFQARVLEWGAIAFSAASSYCSSNAQY